VKYATLLLALCICISTFAQTNYWQQQVNYKMDVTLNDAEHSLDGFAKIEYINHSPDTLRYIWFHLWPNAYRTDRTAFSDQLLKNGRTDFYFSNKEDRGYINRLDFRVNDARVKTEDHPQHIDIVKVILNQPLSPGSSVIITTPFHVQLPKNFSRGGHVGQSYQVTQWYPKPAVYDKSGWHEMPYLDQGEFYNNFGNYEVKVTVPKNYVVLSSGDLQNEEEKQWLLSRKNFTVPVVKSTVKPGTIPSKTKPNPIPSSKELKTLIYKQNNISDFAWFADKKWAVLYDTIQTKTGKVIDVYTAYKPAAKTVWLKSPAMVKDAIQFRSNLIGDYPYNTVAVVEAQMGFEGGMEYPCITSISPTNSEEDLESVIEHEVGHNWFQAMIGNNERRYAWLDEGINSYYDKRFDKEASRYAALHKHEEKDVANEHTFLSSFYQWKKDQPLNTSSDSLTEMNYGLTAYVKGAAFMQLLENKLGRVVFDKAMQTYFQQWQFRHPDPKDLKAVLEQSSSVNLDHEFSLLNQKGPLLHPSKIKLKFKPLIGTGNDSTRIIMAAPIIGYNMYDGVMPGAVITNYTLPTSKFQFLIAPMYGVKSKDVTGIGRLSYTFQPAKTFDRITIALSGMKFTTDDFTDTAGVVYRTGFRKLVPSIKFVLKEKDALSTRERFFQWKTFLFDEDDLDFKRDTFSNGNRFTKITKTAEGRYLNQLRYVIRDGRALYPYNAELMAEQAKNFVRLAFTGNYYFNYNEKHGVDVRLFAGKFFYTGNITNTVRFQTDPFHFNLTGANGQEDYTYNNYFIGRNEFEGMASQQIMQRDGFFKVRTDLLASKVGKTDNWLMALNFTSDVPDQINILNVLPVKIPLKVFLDIGTFAEAWDTNAEVSRIVYDAGFQLSLFKNTLNIYVPVLYSKVFKDYFQSYIPEKRFVKNITFSINIQNISFKTFDRRLPF
jgi:Peptidase family M1 domain